MTDDSTSRSAEDAESAEGERRPGDDGERPPSDTASDPQTDDPQTSEEQTETIDSTTDQQSADNEQSADPASGAATSEPPSDDDSEQTDSARQDDFEPAENADRPADSADPETLDNPGSLGDSENFDDPESDADPDVQEALEGMADVDAVAPPAPDGAESVPAEDDQQTPSPVDFVPEDVQKYERFKKMDGARYERVNEFLRDRTYVTAREWAIARLCSDFRTETGVEMTKIGENLPRLVPFMEDTYTPQAVNQARHSFEEKVRKSGATFLYGAMSGFFTAEQLDDVMYEITEVAKFLLEVEGVDLSVEEELEAEDRILSVMREVRESSEQLRHEGVTCPECGHEIGAEGDD